MFGIAIPCIQHSQAMLEHGVCELAHSFFHFFKIFTMDWYPQLVWSHVVCWGQSKALASYCLDIYLTYNKIPRVHFILNLKNMLNFQISQLFSLCAHTKYMLNFELSIIFTDDKVTVWYIYLTLIFTVFVPFINIVYSPSINFCCCCYI